MRTNLKDTEIIIDEINSNLKRLSAEIGTTELRESYEYLVENGGKRFRPLMTALSCAMFSGDYRKSIRQGTAIELLHNFTLVHDDIMDKSPLRRGKETIYQKWNDTIAILLGDLVLGISFKELVADLELSLIPKALEIFNNGLVEVCQGQGFDLDFESKNDITLSEYEMMIDQKTGSLIRTSLLLGGLVGGADDVELSKLKMVGTELGKVFQLQDDLLDISGQTKDFGKKVGQDIREGKKTYLIIKAKEMATKQEHIALINKFYENSGLEENEVVLMKDLFEELGILQDVQTLLDDRFELIFKMIVDIRDNEYSELLISLLKKYNKRAV
jgi:geranylgeranyl diphosphate synthase type II